MKVSNKLLGEVLDKNIVDSKYMSINRNIYYHEKDVIYAQTVNIYELAHLCKEWAWDKHKQVMSSMIDEQTARTPNETTQWYSSSTRMYHDTLDGVYADTEPEAIFKACEWIFVSTDTKSHIRDAD